MSESEYRSAREAARARVAVLEAKLRDHESHATPMRELEPSTTHAEEKRRLRERLGKISKGRSVFLLGAAVIFASVARHALISGSGVGIFAIAALVLIAVAAVRRRKPSGKERQLELRLRELIKIEDDEYARFRVETSPLRARIDFEMKAREQIESELDEARVLAEAEEKKT
jgi:hypothetical protein